MLRPHLQPSGFKPHMLPNDSRCRLDAFESILIFIGVKYFLGIIREALWEAILYKLKQVVSSFGKHCNQPSWITPTDSDLFGWNNDEVKQGFLCIRYFQYVWFFLKSLTPWLSISWNSPKFSHIWSHFRFCSWRNWYQDGFLKQTFPPPQKKNVTNVKIRVNLRYSYDAQPSGNLLYSPSAVTSNVAPASYSSAAGAPAYTTYSSSVSSPSGTVTRKRSRWSWKVQMFLRDELEVHH